MSAYGELVERCRSVVEDHYGFEMGDEVRSILAEVMRTLETETTARATADDKRTFLRLLHASPLAQPSG